MLLYAPFEKLCQFLYIQNDTMSIRLFTDFILVVQVIIDLDVEECILDDELIRKTLFLVGQNIIVKNSLMPE